MSLSTRHQSLTHSLTKDAGEFATSLSGMTSESSWLYPHAVTAYRFHDADPLVNHASTDTCHEPVEYVIEIGFGFQVRARIGH